jgi:DNA-3-methyladenine glycosylase I
MPDVSIGDDGVARCSWDYPAEYRWYHDDEWGRPVVDDRRIYEKLCLEGFQSGLSWLTILRKRENFRRAFAGFEIEAVAAFDERHVAQLLGDAGIVRNRRKIEATIANARAALELRQSGGSLAALIWNYEPVKTRPPKTLAELPVSTPESTALSKDLRRRGFRFVGPTTIYAAMQALGVVNDHLDGCASGVLADAERAALRRPR